MANVSWPNSTKVEKFFGDKMYQGERRCVPETFVVRVGREHHEAASQVVGKRLLAELSRRYLFALLSDHRASADRSIRECLVCQA